MVNDCIMKNSSEDFFADTPHEGHKEIEEMMRIGEEDGMTFVVDGSRENLIGEDGEMKKNIVQHNINNFSEIVRTYARLDNIPEATVEEYLEAFAAQAVADGTAQTMDYVEFIDEDRIARAMQDIRDMGRSAHSATN